MVRGLLIVAALAAVFAAAGCHPSSAGEQLIPVPAGLDSLERARWLERQRAQCPGHLGPVFDEGAFGHEPDSALHHDTVELRAVLTGVSCRRASAGVGAHRDHPPNDVLQLSGATASEAFRLGALTVF
jgi:hypothetical protein